MIVSLMFLYAACDASEGMRKLGVHEMNVKLGDPKINIFIPLFPTTSLVITTGLYNTNHFAQTVYYLCIKS